MKQEKRQKPTMVDMRAVFIKSTVNEMNKT